MPKSGVRYVTVRARTIETEATERMERTEREGMERKAHAEEEVGAFAGRRKPSAGNSRGRLERRRERRRP